MKKKQLLALALVGAMSATSAASMVSAKEEGKKVEQYERYDKVSDAEWTALKSRVKKLHDDFSGDAKVAEEYKDFVGNIKKLNDKLVATGNESLKMHYNKAFKDINLVFGTKLGSLDGSTEQLSLNDKEFYEYAKEIAKTANDKITVLKDSYNVNGYELDGKTSTLTEVRDRIDSKIAAAEKEEIDKINADLENAKSKVSVENVEAQKEVVAQQSLLMQTRDKYFKVRSDAMKALAQAEMHIRLRNVLTSISAEAIASMNEADKLAANNVANEDYNKVNFIRTSFTDYKNIEDSMYTFTDKNNVKHTGYYDDFRTLVDKFVAAVNDTNGAADAKVKEEDVTNYFLGNDNLKDLQKLALENLEKSDATLKADADNAREIGNIIKGIEAYYGDATLLGKTDATYTTALNFTEDSTYKFKTLNSGQSTNGDKEFPTASQVNNLYGEVTSTKSAYDTAVKEFTDAKAKVEKDINLLNIVQDAIRVLEKHQQREIQKQHEDSVVAAYEIYKDKYDKAKNKYELNNTAANKKKFDDAKADLDLRAKLIETAVKDHKAAYDSLVTIFTKMFTSTFKEEQKEFEEDASQKMEVFNKVADELSLPKFISNSLSIVEPSQVINGSWVKVDGMWYYKDSKANNLHASDWAKIDGVWYRFDANGAMLANKWFKDSNNRWYWLSGSGRMAEDEWVQVDNNWFYAYGSGAIAENEWVLVNGTWYYAQNGGYIAIDKTLNINGVDYSFDATGALK